jgi:predicted SAM-dependent methyltransferase
VQNLKYLDVGCGANTHESFVGVDYEWNRGLDVCWDIRQGLPFADNRFRGIFSEHCLEHFSLNQVLFILHEMRRVLVPGGRIRLVVPDAGLYLKIYHQQVSGDGSQPFPFQDQQQQHPVWSALMSVNQVFYQDRDSPYGHCNMFDADSLKRMLEHCGFSHIQQVRYGQGDKLQLCIEQKRREVESLYMEATA